MSDTQDVTAKAKAVLKKIDLDRELAEMRLLAGGISEQLHNNVIVTGADAVESDVRLPFGVLSLDMAVGGGVPPGTFVGIYGADSAGKSVLAYKFIAAAQKHCRYCYTPILDLDCKCPPIGHCRRCNTEIVVGKARGRSTAPMKCNCPVGGVEEVTAETRTRPCRALWWDAEKCHTEKWAKQCGVEPRLLMVMRPDSSEQGGDIVSDMLKRRAVDIIVIDSIANLVPKEEEAASLGDSQIGRQAYMVNRFCRVWESAMAKHGLLTRNMPIVVMLNQIREAVGKKAFHGNAPEKRPGGHAQDHVESIRIRLSKGQDEVDSALANRAIKRPVNFMIKKNKTATPSAKGSYAFHTFGESAGSVEDEKAVVEQAAAFGLVVQEKPGKPWQLLGEHGKVIGEYRIKSDLVKAVMDDETVYWTLRQAVIRTFLEEVEPEVVEEEKAPI